MELTDPQAAASGRAPAAPVGETAVSPIPADGGILLSRYARLKAYWRENSGDITTGMVVGLPSLGVAAVSLYVGWCALRLTTQTIGVVQDFNLRLDQDRVMDRTIQSLRDQIEREHRSLKGFSDHFPMALQLMYQLRQHDYDTTVLLYSDNPSSEDVESAKEQRERLVRESLDKPSIEGLCADLIASGVEVPDEAISSIRETIRHLSTQEITINQEAQKLSAEEIDRLHNRLNEQYYRVLEAASSSLARKTSSLHEIEQNLQRRGGVGDGPQSRQRPGR